MIVERSDRRVLGAVRFVDATTRQPVDGVVVASADGLRFARGGGSTYVATAGPGLRAVTESFDPPPDAATPPRTFTLTVADPAGRYVARAARVALPRSAVPTDGNPPAVARAVEVPLYPAVSAQVGSGWALVRGTVFRKDSAERLPGAVVRVTRLTGSAVTVVGRAQADGRGEVLVAVPGLPVTAWNEVGGAAVVVTRVAVTVRTLFDPARPAVPDPDLLDAEPPGVKASSLNLELAPGETRVQSLFVDLA